MAILNYDNIYTQKGAPNATVNPKIVGAVWFDYETGVTYTCKDNTMNKNVWVRCCRTEDELLEFIKENTKKPTIDNSFGDFTEEETIVPEYDFDLNVENDFDWVCPPNIYPMFRYGKYLIVPMECDYTTREDISTDILYTNRGTVALTNPARAPAMYVPGNINKRLTATRVNFNLQSVGFSNHIYNMFVYPNHFGNVISHFPAIDHDRDIIGDLLVKHRDYSRWIPDRRFGVLLAPLINDNENRNDLRRGVNFSLLKSVENDPDVIWSFVSIYTRRDQSNRILTYTETGNWINVPGSFTIGSNTIRFTYKYGVYVAELHAINKGICNYLAIRMYT